MEGGMRSGDVIVKKRNSSGCLIVRKRNYDGAVRVGSSSGLVRERESERPRLISRSVMSDEVLLSPSRGLAAPGAMRVGSGSSVYRNGAAYDGEFSRRQRIGSDGNEYVGRNGEGRSERKRSRLEEFEVGEYEGIDDNVGGYGGRRFLGSLHSARSGREREYRNGYGGHYSAECRRKSYVDWSRSVGRGDYVESNEFGMQSINPHLPVSWGDRSMGQYDKPIRLQGKNGVLKVMVNKNKNIAGLLKHYDQCDFGESMKISVDVVRRNTSVQPSNCNSDQPIEKLSLARPERQPLNLQKSLSTESNDSCDSEAEGSDLPLKLGSKDVVTPNAPKNLTHEVEKTPSSEKLQTGRIKEGKVRRGSGTEKQKLREHIRSMLVAAGWTIDYRPRKNRDYLDAVYINPSGTAYWSIIKAYEAFQKQSYDEGTGKKPVGDGSAFPPISDELLGQLTRRTRKKLEKEMKKQRDSIKAEHTREAAGKRTKKRKKCTETLGNNYQEEKSNLMELGGRPLEHRMTDKDNNFVNLNSKGQSSSHPLHDDIDKLSLPIIPGRKPEKFGRCTLLIRNSSKRVNEPDGYVPYAGKLTLLSWLIDSRAVQLSQKVQYMNRRRNKVMLEGWITRDGIHCGCCSKILSVSKFEIHAGSKLRQPFQNIYLDSGESLLQCQIDAWNRQKQVERIGFHSVDIDPDDPNDDTCGICGDGGDLICCDSCPSTFHLSCLDIQVLPPGDWHCPNCSCKICRLACNITTEDDGTTVCLPPTCSLCQKKYHKTCVQEMDDHPTNANGLTSRFCSQDCKELFEHLQKYLGVKHELEAGFSWSLIRRMDIEADTYLHGLPQRVECNSKLAVALTVMDECFCPLVDKRNGINIIQNVLYNCGSNFSRLNYSGFYTAILERGDELISAASIRFRGTQLAEMPFIGTRYMYRHQGMCRRLFSAIESSLCSLKVDKLIIPAIPELIHTWTTVFGFTPLEQSLKRELRSINMLVFPGVNMLQKQLLKHHIEKRSNFDAEKEKPEGTPAKMEVARKCDGRTEKTVFANLDSQCSAASLYDTAQTGDSLNASPSQTTSDSDGDTTCSESQPGDIVAESAVPMNDPQKCDDITLHPISKNHLEVASPGCKFQRLDASLKLKSQLRDKLSEPTDGERVIIATHVEVETKDPNFDPAIAGRHPSSDESHTNVLGNVDVSSVCDEPGCSPEDMVAEKTQYKGYVSSVCDEPGCSPEDMVAEKTQYKGC